MLLVIGILLLATGVPLTFVLGIFGPGANLGTGRGGAIWPGLLVIALGIVCLVARHWLHGKAITW